VSISFPDMIQPSMKELPQLHCVPQRSTPMVQYVLKLAVILDFRKT